MKFSYKLKSNKSGFTLIEILIVLAILIIVGGFAVIAGFNIYKSNILVNEQTTLINVLQKARTNSITNISNSSYGVSIQDSDYVIFKGDSYFLRDEDYDEIHPKSGLIANSGNNTEIVFERITGNVTSTEDIILTGPNGNSLTISINNEGAINWQ